MSQQTNNSMVSLGALLQERETSPLPYEIPLYQRNYKWAPTLAKKLLTDLWENFKNETTMYSVGMVSLHKEEDKFLLIDGQQRCITLTMLLHLVDSLEEPTGKNYFKLTFARDKNLSPDSNLHRLSFLLTPNQTAHTIDQTRFARNFKAMHEDFTEQLKNYPDEEHPEIKASFRNFLLHNVFLLYHVSELEPLNEFLNINQHKTPFSIIDHAKGHFVLATTLDSENTQLTRENVFSLFSALSQLLYRDDTLGHQKIQSLLPSLSAPDWKPIKNRLSLLFEERIPSVRSENKSVVSYNLEEWQKLDSFRAHFSTLLDHINQEDFCSFHCFVACLTHTTKQSFIHYLDTQFTTYPPPPLEAVYYNTLLKQSQKDVNVFVACIMDEENWRTTESEEGGKTLDSIKEGRQFYNTVVAQMARISHHPFTLHPHPDREQWCFGTTEDITAFLHDYHTYITEKYNQQEREGFQ